LDNKLISTFNSKNSFNLIFQTHLERIFIIEKSLSFFYRRDERPSRYMLWGIHRSFK